MSENEHIFLSYRSIEADFALKLVADLKNIGLNIWLDRLDAGIKVGDDWVQALQNAINSSVALIAVLSPEYVHSKYCRRELKRADTLGRPIYPVLLVDIEKEDWPFEIQEKQYIDFRDWQHESKYRFQFEKLVTVLRQQSPSQFGGIPDLEIRYLTSLIAELEAHRGVLEYVDLSGEAEGGENERFKPSQDLGWEQEFALLNYFEDISNSKQIPLGSLREAVEQYSSFILIGEPGSGKTTTIRKLAVNAAHERLQNPRTAPLPLFLNLSNWENEPTPADFVRAHWPFNSDPKELLIRGEILLYLDGLNEMGATTTTKAKLLREWLQGKETPQKVIITCRKFDYTPELDLKLPVVLAKDLDNTRIEQFAVNYLESATAKTFLSEIFPKTDFPQNQPRKLFVLARNPYLLAALIYIFQNAPKGELPHALGPLFKALTMALWAREERRRTLGWIAFKEMEAKFSQLAFSMIDNEMPVDVTQDYALKHVSNLALLQAGQSASLLLIQNEHVRFYHQLMQEYFAAIALLDDSYDKSKYIKGGDKWKYVMAAWSGFISNTDELIELLYEVDDIEAHWLVQAGYNVPDYIREAFLQISCLGDYDHKDFEYAINALIRIGTPAVPLLLRRLESMNNEERYRAIFVLGSIGDKIAVPALIARLDDRAISDELFGPRRICDAAATALENIATPEALAAVAKWKRE